MTKNKTLEEIAMEEIGFPKYCYPTTAMEETARYNFIKGIKWQRERSNLEAEQYAEFCIICYKNNLPLVCFKDWNKQLKNI
jgi:hypothetical protein